MFSRRKYQHSLRFCELVGHRSRQDSSKLSAVMRRLSRWHAFRFCLSFGWMSLHDSVCVGGGDGGGGGGGGGEGSGCPPASARMAMHSCLWASCEDSGHNSRQDLVEVSAVFSRRKYQHSLRFCEFVGHSSRQDSAELSAVMRRLLRWHAFRFCLSFGWVSLHDSRRCA